jgi:hypothetical protein
VRRGKPMRKFSSSSPRAKLKSVTKKKLTPAGPFPEDLFVPILKPA